MWAHKDVIEETLNDLAALITIFAGIIPVAKSILRAHEQRLVKENIQQYPIKITIVIDGEPISVEASDFEQVEVDLKLAKQFHSFYPAVAAKVTWQSKVTVKDSVSKRQSHGRS